ncbi:MAG: SlyX family protein [Gammaproteobacteria bacterium]|nr:SlyX family protein [Gammaproteobacteria bacterium]
MQDRITELETKLAFQEDTLQALNDIVTRQQAELYQLRKEISALHEQLRAMTPSMIATQAEETPPPHY